MNLKIVPVQSKSFMRCRSTSAGFFRTPNVVYNVYITCIHYRFKTFVSSPLHLAREGWIIKKSLVSHRKLFLLLGMVTGGFQLLFH